MRPPVVIAVAIISALSACSSASTHVDKAPIAANANEVVISDYKFYPPKLTVPVGTTVKWVNHDIAPHTATHRSFAAEAFDTGSLGHNETFSHTFKTTGTYDYLCVFHQGMMGTIIVQ
jgi:plastocyanin